MLAVHARGLKLCFHVPWQACSSSSSPLKCPVLTATQCSAGGIFWATSGYYGGGALCVPCEHLFHTTNMNHSSICCITDKSIINHHLRDPSIHQRWAGHQRPQKRNVGHLTLRRFRGSEFVRSCTPSSVQSRNQEENSDKLNFISASVGLSQHVHSHL